MGETRRNIEKLFSELEDKELVLSVLAEVSDRLLSEYKQDRKSEASDGIKDASKQDDSRR